MVVMVVSWRECGEGFFDVADMVVVLASTAIHSCLLPSDRRGVTNEQVVTAT